MSAGAEAEPAAADARGFDARRLETRCLETRCFHCGESLPDSGAAHARIDGRERAFCCTGCAAAAHWIDAAALGDYYRLRERDAGRVDPDLAGAQAVDDRVWDRADLLAEHARAVPGGCEIVVLTDGMRCAACAWLIDRALSREAGVSEVAANALTGRIRIVWDPAQVALSALLGRLRALGYGVSLATGDARERARRAESRRWMLRLGIAALGTMQAMMFAEALYLDFSRQMPEPTRDFFRWITFLVSTPVVFYSGWPFIAGMWRELRGRRLGMDTLIAGSTLLAYGASLVETIRGGTHVWYDAAVMFVFLLLTARLFEARARGIASAQVDAMARARPALCLRERDDGVRERVPPAALVPGDVVHVAVGEAVPADGVLLDESAAFDESLLSGESHAVEKAAGGEVFAGSHCRERPARLRIVRTGADTRLSQLTRLVERAQEQRPALAQATERIGMGFTALLLIAAAATYAWWRVHDPARAFEVALAVLVVSCPCALSLAVPAALTAAHGALAKLGVLALRPDALQTLARVDRVVFDKTGTLGARSLQLTQVELLPHAAQAGLDAQAALRIAAALEAGSGHPLEAAFVDARTAAHDSVAPQASGRPASVPHAPGDEQAQASVATQRRNEAGRGVGGCVDGRIWRLGRGDWAAPLDARAQTPGGAGGHAEDAVHEQARDVRDDALWLGDGERAFARFVLRETPREDARAAVSALDAQGIAVTLCSGDAAPAVARMAEAVGIATCRARQSPEDKLAHVRERQAAGEVVAMVGDGINDAPVLAGADVSLALADGAALAQRAADCVIVGGHLMRVPQAVALARRTRRIVRENLAWALGYNIVALPLAMMGLVTPWLAAIGMSLSSLLVTLNALRLLRAPRTADAGTPVRTHRPEDTPVPARPHAHALPGAGLETRA